jgi:hypothetical protein
LIDAYHLVDLTKLCGDRWKTVHQPERLCLRIFEHLGHQLDLEAANNSPNMQQALAELQEVVATWFSQYLTEG